jgi:hypothetical protein
MANRIQIQTALQKPYDRILFGKEVLSPVFGSCFNLSSSTVPASVQPNKSEQAVIQSVSIYGIINLEDGTEITCYEIILQPTVRIEHSKVTIQRYVRKLLTAGQIALVNFIAPQNKKVWRLTLVAKDSELTEQGIKEKTTHAKRYTYLLGPSETCKTAAERFESLSTEKQITFQALVNAFSVEKLSEAFFDEYTLHYQKFCDYLQESNFRKSVFKITIPVNAAKEEKDKACKPIRDFVKKLLGRIVFLYFVQKKGWLGASDTNYKDGLTDFIKQLFKQSGGNDAFYSTWLTVLFFETLNKERNNDDFKMPDGKKVKVPFLNGGLFDKEDYDEAVLTLPAKLFHHPDFEDTQLTEKNKDHARGFLDFLDAFNFTVHEDSPDDHTVAVDPEMLGHIFENLLEDNKDKGAFYTPKEIVHYMCQESLTEYLTTHCLKHRLQGLEDYTDEQIRNMIAHLVKYKEKHQQLETLNSAKSLNLLNLWFRQLDTLLDTVKICDPAIGSGAFPMGLLQEIHAIKEVIAYELQQPWKPADVKENIIQNSVYGVDIEKGAVDIARLRFWLSLVVDEEKPRALPNLDYKIVVGDSLVSKFEGEIIEIDWEIKEGTQANLFGNENVIKRQALLKKITEKQQEYFHATNKQKLAAEIRNLKIDILINQLELMLNTKGLEKKPTETGKKAAAQMELWLQTQGWKNAIAKLQKLKQNKEDPFEHFDWKLDFPEVLNPYLVNGNAGFDIVIGNPPYIKIQSIPKELITYFKRKFKSATGKYDIYVIFIEHSMSLLKKEGNLTFINPHRFLIAEYGLGLRDILFKKRALSKLVYFGVNQIFETATTYTGLFFLKENSDKFYFAIPETKNLDSLAYAEKEYSRDNFNFSVQDNNDPIIAQINKYKKVSEIFDGVYQGLIPMGDDIHVLEGRIKGSYFSGYSKVLGETVKIEKDLMKPLLKGENIQRYQKLNSDIYIFYPHFTNKKGKTEPYTEKEMKSLFPLGYEYISNFKSELKTKKIKYKTNPAYWYSLHRSREQYIFENPKLITPQLQNHPAFSFDKDGLYADAGGYIILQKKGDPVSLETYLSVFNSKLFYYFIQKTSTPYNNNYYYFKTNYIEPFCIPFNIDSFDGHFKPLVHYITYLKTVTLSDISEQLIPTYFEQIIDGMVYELYFPGLIKKHKREIIPHLGELPEFTDKMSDEQKMNICKMVFNRLNNPQHPVRQNLEGMKEIPEIRIIEGNNAEAK